VIRRLGEYLNLIALTLWVGGLWTIGFVVAPTLFRSLDSRAQAGAIAGELFSLMAYIGLACGGYLALYRLFRFGAGALRQLCSGSSWECCCWWLRASLALRRFSPA
jgi:uncharacterized membrane protein